MALLSWYQHQIKWAINRFHEMHRVNTKPHLLVSYPESICNLAITQLAVSCLLYLSTSPDGVHNDQSWPLIGCSGSAAVIPALGVKSKWGAGAGPRPWRPGTGTTPPSGLTWSGPTLHRKLVPGTVVKSSIDILPVPQMVSPSSYSPCLW